MSLYCPKCWNKARTYDSRCDPLTNSVWRRHECLDASCRHRFTTMELIVGEVDLRRGGSSKLLELCWELFDKLGGEASEDEFLRSYRQMLEDRKIRDREYKMKKRVPGMEKPPKPAKEHPWRNMPANKFVRKEKKDGDGHV